MNGFTKAFKLHLNFKLSACLENGSRLLILAVQIQQSPHNSHVSVRVGFRPIKIDV